MQPNQRGTTGLKWWIIGGILLVATSLFPISCIGTGDHGTMVFSFGSVSVNARTGPDGERTTKVRTGLGALRPD